MGWIALYVLFIPLIGGGAWLIVRSIKEKNTRSQEIERIQQRIAEKEAEAQREDADS